MDFTPIIISFLSSFWFLIPFFILAALLKSPWFKGVFGEAQVNLAATLFLNKNDYHLIKNVTLPTEDGTTQIDHIIVSRYGIFVIETKNMKGWIFGNPSQKTWTQKIYKHTNKFQNPLHQNYKHTKTLESCLGLSDEMFFSLIVFVGDSTFKTDMPHNVTYAGGYLRFIKSKTSVLLTNDEVSTVIGAIEGGRLTPSLKTQREHVKHVKSNLEDKQSSNLCPKCGSELVLRLAKKGVNKGNEFMACSGFPKCRYATSLQ
jgi:hypothetical protein